MSSHVHYNVNASVVECQSIDTLDQCSINTLVDTWSTLNVGQESTTCNFSSRHAIECQTIQATIHQLLSIKCWLRHWRRVSIDLSIKCWSSADWGSRSKPKLQEFSAHMIQKCTSFHTRFIYLLELNSRLVVSVFSFCLPCLEEGKWPFDRIYLLLECIVIITGLHPALPLPGPIYTPGWRKAPRTQHNVPARVNEPGLLDPEPSALTMRPPSFPPCIF